MVDTSNIHIDNEILTSESLVNCVVSTMLLHWCSSLNIFNAEKSVNGHVKKSITCCFSSESHFAS